MRIEDCYRKGTIFAEGRHNEGAVLAEARDREGTVLEEDHFCESLCVGGSRLQFGLLRQVSKNEGVSVADYLYLGFHSL